MGRLLGGCLLWAIAAGVLVFGLYHMATSFTSEFRPFLAPGKIAATVESAEGAALPLTLWYDYETTFDGKEYSTGKALTGAKFRAVEDQSGGKAYPLTVVDKTSETKVSFGKVQRVLVGTFELKPGKYHIEVSGLKQPGVFSLGPNPLKMIGGFMVVLVVAGLFALLGLIAIILGIIKLGKGKQPPQQSDDRDGPGGPGGGLGSAAGPLLAGGALAAGGAALVASEPQKRQQEEDFFRDNPSDSAYDDGGAGDAGGDAGD